ncbi:MAG TPA: glycoside hydrolase family 36 protein, partial [Chitinophagaceae bacterium]|nr:glycoside hydrolase family 36 protein [Chitinophagaceae bacterium]
MRKACLLLVLQSLTLIVLAQSFASWTKTELKLSNGIVERLIQLPAVKGKFITTVYKPVNGDFYYFTDSSTDFRFAVNNKIYSGKSKWSLRNIEKYNDPKGGDGAAVNLVSEDGKIELTIQFLLYPASPAIRKNLRIKNLGQQTIRLESVDVEKFYVTEYSSTTFSWICHDYGRRRSLGPYDGTMQDALVIVHNSDWQQGIVIGNEASGAMKHTSVFWEERTIISGLTHKEARYPFRKYLNKGEEFTTPQVFTMVYNNHKDPDEILNTAVPDFVRKNMGIRLSELREKPIFVYNTWIPFGQNINERLVTELAKSAADAGMKEFIIDDGWQENYGDWEIDKKKFPNGLKPVFDYIKSLGMKPGLWVSVGSATPSSKVFKAHPEWFVLDEKGQRTNLHNEDPGIFTACFGTGWYDYIRDILMKLSLEYGLEYLKLDFTVVTSPYRFAKNQTGCYASAHRGHKDHHESLFTNYEQVWRLFDELHKAKPDLFIDCTFETMGALQLIDYAMLKHAEGNWLSNFSGPEAKVDLRIRNMAWWRSPAIPATALVIGNPEMQDTAWDLHIESLAGSLPIMLGDPRKLPAKDFAKYRSYADWMQLMENLYGIMSYRQDLPGFGEPKEGMWDGFQRINTETKKGGIAGVFRQGSMETKRLVTVNY